MIDVAAWLVNQGLEQYVEAFADNAIDGDLLRILGDDDLKEIGVKALGHRKKLLAAIAALSEERSATPPISDDIASTAASSNDAERRHLTVMFVDLVGSAELSASLDPEEMRDIMRAYQDACAGPIARFEGHVAKYMGDGILAYFGWPRAHEDDAERAVRAGLDLVAAVARLVTASGSLAARIGIATGLVVVGDLIGQGAAQERSVVGDTPNLASRLQGLAEPNQVVIAEATARLVGAAFNLQSLGAQRIKGIAGQPKPFVVTGERAVISRFEARSGSSLLPMVGRDQELALILERWRQAKGGEGQGVVLIGEAGIGKSRLVRAVLDTIADEEHTLLRYQCSPQHTASALWPVVQQVGFAARLEPSDSVVVKLEKLKLLLRLGRGEIWPALPLIANLLSINVGECHSVIELTPQQQRAQTLAALAEQPIGLAKWHPVLIVVEDAHWIDPTTLELLGLALDRIADARVLVLITARPDDQPALLGHPHLTRLSLNRLSRGPTEAIIAHLTDGRFVPPEMLAQIAARTDGVPLFVEELTKAVFESNFADSRAAVPLTLQDSLMARLDRVSRAREVAQVASCIGREFNYTLLATISPVPELELRSALDQLTAAELVFRRGQVPEATYIFKHALVQEAAYQSLLKSRRKQLHAKIIRALKDNIPEQIETNLDVAAHHCTQAGLFASAVDYRCQAGMRALSRFAMAEATAQLNEGLALIKNEPDGIERDRRELEMQLALSRALLFTKGAGAKETGSACMRAHQLAERQNDIRQLYAAIAGEFSFYFMRAEHNTALEAANTLLSTARQHQSDDALCIGHLRFGEASFMLGAFADARASLKRSLEVGEQLESCSALSALLPHNPRTHGLNYLAWALFALGYLDQAMALCSQAIAEARMLSDPFVLADAMENSCSVYILCRNPKAVGETADGLVALVTETKGFSGNLGLAAFARGWVIAEEGQPGEAIEPMYQGISSYRATGSDAEVPHQLCVLAEVHCKAGQPAAALRLLDEASTLMARTGERWCEAELHRRRGIALLALPNPTNGGAEACFERALTIAREQNARAWQLRAARDLGRLWSNQGKLAEARELLESVYGLFTEGFDMPDLREAKALLDALA